MLKHSLLAVLSTLLLAAAARAEDGPRPPHGMLPGHRLEQHLDELGLEAAQRERIDALLAGAKQERKSHFEEVRAAFEELRALLDQDAPDEAAVMAQADRLGELRNAGHKAMLHTLLAVRAELTPEQRTALREKMREDRQHRRGFFRRWKGGPPDAPPEP